MNTKASNDTCVISSIDCVHGWVRIASWAIDLWLGNRMGDVMIGTSLAFSCHV